LIPILLFCLGLAARLPNWGWSGLWLDECITAYRVVDLHTVFTLNDGSPWFYPFVVWLSTTLLGSSDTALRLPSLLAGAALGPAIYLVVRQRCPISVALFPALLGVFNSYSLHYSQEARVYSFGMFLAVLWFGALFALLDPADDKPPSRGLVTSFIALSPMLALCHHYCLFVGASGAIVAAIRLAGDPDLRARVLKPILAAYGLTVLLWLPSMLMFTLSTAQQVGSAQPNPYAPHLSYDVAVQHLLGTVLSPYRFSDWMTTAGFVMGAAVLCLALGLPGRRREWYFGMEYLLCLGFVVAANAVVPNFVSGRYETVFLGIALATLGLAVSLVANRFLRIGLMVVLLGGQLYACNTYWQVSVPKSSSLEVAQFIAANKPDLVVATLPRGFDPIYLMPMTYYLHKEYRLDLPIMEIPRFQMVPDGFIPPTDYYLLYHELLAVPPAEVLQKLKATLDSRGTVAIIGQDAELNALVPVLQDYTIRTSSVFGAFNEGLTRVLILDTQRPRDEGAESEDSK